VLVLAIVGLVIAGGWRSRWWVAADRTQPHRDHRAFWWTGAVAGTVRSYTDQSAGRHPSDIVGALAIRVALAWSHQGISTARHPVRPQRHLSVQATLASSGRVLFVRHSLLATGPGRTMTRNRKA